MSAPLTTFPGTVTPLRGLAPFVETERDVFFGRDAERDAVTRLVTQDGTRAGLVYGEPGVGKSSLLRAGVAPHLRDHGVVALACDDFAAPAEGFARALAAASAVPVRPGEKAVDYLLRVVSQAVQGQLYVFVIDDVDVALRADPSGHVAAELAELFQRLTTRTSGRGRFLFGAADVRLGTLDSLERRTGSLFPPLARFRVQRFTGAQAYDVIDRTLALAGLGADPAIARTFTDGLVAAGRGAVLPADVQLAARALRDLRLGSAAELLAAGGAGRLFARWIEQCAGDAGQVRHGLRLLGGLAAHDEPAAFSAADLARAAGVAEAAAVQALPGFTSRGLTVVVPLAAGSGYALAHELLVPRLRELAAPAVEAATRAQELLAAAAAGRRVLGPLELAELDREGIAPSTPAEARAIGARKRKHITMLAAAVATPIVLLVVIAVTLSGRFFFSRDGSAGPGGRVLVRAGRPSLAAFFWLPGRSGKVIADPGLSAPMIGAVGWKRLGARAVSGSIAGSAAGRAEPVAAALSLLRPPLAPLLAFALDPRSENALDEARKTATTPAEVLELLTVLAPIARGGPKETALVTELLADPTPAVRRAALDVALAVARRKPGSYQAVIGAAMAATDAEVRARALAGAHGLGTHAESSLLAEALAKAPAPAVRRDLLAALAALPSVSAAASAGVAAAMLMGAAGAKLEPAEAEAAWRMLEAAFERDAAGATAAATRLVGDGETPTAVRVRALALAVAHAPTEALVAAAADIEAAVQTKDPDLAAAALPLYARVAPEEAARKLVGFADPPPVLRAAIASAWGELAKSRPDAAFQSLEPMLDDRAQSVRIAAARAFGKLGKPAQEPLIKIAKNAGGDLAEAAAWGLAASVEAGASASEAAVGIGQLWKRKGQARRDAARVFASLCKVKPAAFIDYCGSAARDAEDRALNPIGVDGLCNAVGAGAAKLASAGLRAAAEGDSAEARRRVAACVATRPAELGETGLKIALRFSEDGDAELRLGAARALTQVVGAGKAPKGATLALAKLLADTDRRVRVAAAAGLAGVDVPKEAGAAVAQAWIRADEAEKLLLLPVAAATGAGATISQAARDASPAVRAKALGAAASASELRKELAPLLGAALMDQDPTVRAEALRLVSDASSGVSGSQALQSLELAAGGDDPDAALAALTALAGLDDPARAAERLAVDLGQRSDGRRARGARAALALSRRDGAVVAKLLEPRLADPSHDVRVAALVSLAAAWAGTLDVGGLAQRLAGAETDAMVRLTALYALLGQAGDDGESAVSAALEKVKRSAPPFVRFTAELGLALLAAGADGPAFVLLLVP
jgi:hypothetical protein